MNSYQIEVACDATMTVGESPLWAPDEKALYWVDIEGFAIHRLCTALASTNSGRSTARHRRWRAPRKAA